MHPRQFELMCNGMKDPERTTNTDALMPRSRREPQSTRGPPLDDDTLLTGKQVRARVGGVTQMCIWRWTRDPRVKFPAPIKINNRNYWRFGDLRRWQYEQVGAQRA
jgi:hypothetical protein